MNKAILEKVMESERENDLVLTQMRESIIAAVAAAEPIKGVKETTVISVQHENGSVSVFKKETILEATGSKPLSMSVNLSAILAQAGMPITAKTYSQKSQAYAVRRYLTPTNKVYELMERLNELLEEKAAVFSDQTIPLNEATLNVLRRFV